MSNKLHINEMIKLIDEDLIDIFDDDDSKEVCFNILTKFKIIEDNGKYLVELKKIFKKGLKDIDTLIFEDVISRLPLNVKDINNLSLDIGFNQHKGEFYVIYYVKSQKMDIYLINCEKCT